MINKEILRLKLVPRTQVEEMVEMLAAQDRRLRELELKLQKEKQDKANLLEDFQNVLDQIKLRGNTGLAIEEPAMVCG